MKAQKQKIKNQLVIQGVTGSSASSTLGSFLRGIWMAKLAEDARKEAAELGAQTPAVPARAKPRL